MGTMNHGCSETELHHTLSGSIGFRNQIPFLYARLSICLNSVFRSTCFNPLAPSNKWESGYEATCDNHSMTKGVCVLAVSLISQALTRWGDRRKSQRWGIW